MKITATTSQRPLRKRLVRRAGRTQHQLWILALILSPNTFTPTRPAE